MEGDLEQFDGLLMTCLQKGAGIQNFFDAVFGFLERKTDFLLIQVKYYVYKKHLEQSFNYVENHYKKWLGKFQEKKDKDSKKKQKQEEEDKKRKQKQEDEEKARIKPTVSSATSVKEITPEECERRKREEQNKNIDKMNFEPTETTQKPTMTSITSTSTEKKEEKEEDKVAEGKVLPTKEGGAKTDKYTWEQRDIKEITMTIPVPGNIRGKDLIIKPESKKLYIGIKGQPPLVDGELHALMKPDSFVWVLEEVKGGKIINISFEKYDTYKWWECVIKGDQCVDTTKIQPEPSKLSDIEDPEMKATVQKMMFDTRQKSMGLPTSDVLQKNSQIEDFIKAHPEMDFSKAKFG